MVDCSGSYGNHGCNGGWPQSAMNYVKDHGIALDSTYGKGYQQKQNTCEKHTPVYKIAGVVNVAANS